MSRVDPGQRALITPEYMEIEGRNWRRAHVETTMDDVARNVLDPIDVGHDMVFFDEAVTEEVVGFEPRDRHILRISQRFSFQRLPVVIDRGQCGLPQRPFVSVALRYDFVVAPNHTGVIGHGRIAVPVKFRGDQGDKTIPRFGEPGPQTTVVHEVDFELAVEEDAPEHHLTDTLRVSNGVEKREGRAPRSANDADSLKAEMLPKQLNIGDEMLRSVIRRLSEGLAFTAAALIEKDHMVLRKVVERQMFLVEV